MAKTGRLSHRTAASVGWSALRFGSDQAFNFVLFAVLARLLTPQQFGVFIAAFIFVEFGKVLANGGLPASLMRAPQITQPMADTVFWANLALGVLVALLGFAGAGLLSAGLGVPDAAPVMRVLAFVVPISALGASHQARTLRNFGHRSLAVRSVLSGLIGGGVAVVAALHGAGVWALVIQRFIVETINVAVAWRAAAPWRPGFSFSFYILRCQIALGSSLMGAQLLLLVNSRAQDAIISRLIGVGALGVYRTAFKSIELIAQGAIFPFSSVSLPALARLQGERAAFERAFLRMVAVSAAISFPAMIGVGVLAPDLIPLLYGRQWSAAVPVAQVIAFLALPYALNMFSEPALTALGRSATITQLAVVQMVGTVVFCLAAAPYGLTAVAGAYVVRAYLTMAIQLWLFERAAGIRAARTLSAVAPPVIAAAIMGMAVFAATPLLHAHITFRPLAVVAAIALGAAVYLPLLGVLAGRSARAEAIAMVGAMLARLPSRA